MRVPWQMDMRWLAFLSGSNQISLLMHLRTTFKMFARAFLLAVGCRAAVA